MRAHAIAAAAVLIATAACGAEPRQQSVSTADARPSVEAATTGAVVAQTELGPLPSPATLAELSDPQGCGQPPSSCVRGGSEGQTAVIWGHGDSPLVFVAHAPDEATLTDLLAAWRSG